ncbi:MAG: hypothetical protein M0R74_05600 [Dehalococcoidia bacterium]|nr:hypothetical protein [Dehalococcoidia bacterium]
MRFVHWLSALALAFPLLAAACGDGANDAGAAPTASAEAAETEFGPPPTLKDNITGVRPEHGSTVRPDALRPANPNIPGGICFDVNFEGFDSGNLQWFRLAVDGEEHTTAITWFPRNENTEATGCYVPAEPLSAGVHQAAVSVQNPSNPSEPTRQYIEWRFEITS